MNPLIEKAARKPYNLTHGEIVSLLALEDTAELFAAAYELKCRHVGKIVSLRGLIEFSNQCSKNCYYCGIRRGNTLVKRYHLSEDDVVRMARWSFEQGYGSVVLQSGELESEANTAFVERVLKRIREFGGDEFGVTLSLGEQTEEVYRRWFEAGAHRYLLRIESSVPALYASLHPADHSHARRTECLRVLSIGESINWGHRGDSPHCRGKTSEN